MYGRGGGHPPTVLVNSKNDGKGAKGSKNTESTKENATQKTPEQEDHAKASGSASGPPKTPETVDLTKENGGVTPMVTDEPKETQDPQGTPAAPPTPGFDTRKVLDKNRQRMIDDLDKESENQ